MDEVTVTLTWQEAYDIARQANLAVKVCHESRCITCSSLTEAAHKVGTALSVPEAAGAPESTTE